jgi:hypothetical protein
MPATTRTNLVDPECFSHTAVTKAWRDPLPRDGITLAVACSAALIVLTIGETSGMAPRSIAADRIPQPRL